MPEQNGNHADNPITALQDDGSVLVYVPVNRKAVEELYASELKNSEDVKASVTMPGDTTWPGGSTWPDGTFYFPNEWRAESYYRLPKLTIPLNYYEQVRWAQEYYQQEGLINALVNRDIEQAITDEEFQLPEEAEDIKGLLEKWRREVNRSIGMHGGLREYNRSLMLDLSLGSLSLTLANWGPMTYKGKVYQMPLVLVNLNPMALLPDIDPFSGQRKYFFKISKPQYDAIMNRRKNSITQIIPDAKSRLTDDITPVVDRLRMLGYEAFSWYDVQAKGYYLDVPVEDSYIINFRGRQHDRWPIPTLVPIFPAIAMKRKLALADWTVADGMVNMIMVWEFPPGSDPKKSKALVQKFTVGGRVQSHAVPAGVKISLITPDATILNSGEKFWQPTSEILAHFGYPLNYRARGAGDLDSGALDQSSNRARMDIWRETIEDHNSFFLRQAMEKNKWNIPDVYAIFQTRDLDNDANFRTFVQGAYDRGDISIETYLDHLNTSIEREAARRKKEKATGMDKLFEIRPTFAQTFGTAADGRPPAGGGKPPANKASGKGPDTQKGLSRSSRGRPSGSGQVKT